MRRGHVGGAVLGRGDHLRGAPVAALSTLRDPSCPINPRHPYGPRARGARNGELPIASVNVLSPNVTRVFVRYRLTHHDVAPREGRLNSRPRPTCGHRIGSCPVGSGMTAMASVISSAATPIRRAQSHGSVRHRRTSTAERRAPGASPSSLLASVILWKPKEWT